MKVILTGKNSYISRNVCRYLISEGIESECVSVRNGVKDIELEGFDVVIHCAAIVHKKEAEYKDEYKKVNYELTKAIADKALKSSVKHFVFISTMAVYGLEEGEINESTPLEPKTLYGKSKLEAEKYVLSLRSEKFKVTVIRPPMVYGKNCPGNYSRLLKLAKIMAVIPDTLNKKSLIYIDNLAYLIKNIIENNREGIYMPMDMDYISTARLMKLMYKRPVSKILGKILCLLPFSVVKKAFGTLYYSNSIAEKIDYISTDEAVRLSKK